MIHFPSSLGTSTMALSLRTSWGFRGTCTPRTHYNRTYHFQKSEFVNVRWEMLQIVVAHVESPQTATEVGEIGGERRAHQIVVREIENF